MARNQGNHQAFQPIPFSNVIIEDGFWLTRIEANRSFALFHQYRQLLQSGAVDNFRRVTGGATGEFEGLFFSDSDVYKWLEAASFALKSRPDPRLESLVDGTIALIAAAQEPSGYVNTYFQLVDPDKKFTNFGVCHELYTISHLILAGIAHFDATGKKSLFEVACRCADHIVDVFGPGKLEAFDGHAGIELALIGLYRVTGKPEYLSLSEFFVNGRGRPDSRLRLELAHLDEIAGKPGKPGQNNRKFFGSFEDYDGRYAQDHLPVRKQTEVVGHAVRAMYLYCGMADLAVETGDSDLVAALERLWHHLTSRRMYVTGGIGSARANEGFTRDYDLPNHTACAESCAAVGMVIWNHRMLNLKGDGRYADLMERVLYNAFLVGVSFDGTKYFYNNPLQSYGDTHREPWYECACCPPNIARILASLGGYIYSRTERGLAVHLFIQSRISFEGPDGQPVVLSQVTQYPWEGCVAFSLEMDRAAGLELRIRIPAWCRNYCLRLNDEIIEASLQNGYIAIDRVWQPGSTLRLTLNMPIERIVSHPAVWQNFGKTALQRGPLIFCLEAADNDFPIGQMVLPDSAELLTRFDPHLCGGVTVIEGEGLVPDSSEWQDKLYSPRDNDVHFRQVRFRAIPYYCWDNRQPGAMTVWINTNSADWTRSSRYDDET